MSRRGKVLTTSALLLAVAVTTPHTTPFLLMLGTRILILAILAMSLDLLLGFTGIASLGHAAFLGLGAYLTAILAVRCNFGLGWSFWLVVSGGIALGALTAAVFALFALRSRGVYFLMITLALSQCVWGLAYRWDSLTGGDNGLNLPGRPAFGPIHLGNDTAFFYLVFAFFALSLLLLYVFVGSPFGKSLVGIREHETRMRILGYNVWLHKYIAFIVSGAFAGLAGVLWAHVSSEVSPEDVTLTTSVDALLMVVLGGPGTLLGGVFGAVIVLFLREYLSTIVPWWPYVLGGMYVAIISYLPDGLLGTLLQRRRALPAAAAPAQGPARPSGRTGGLEINQGGIE
ncbi:MAG TPA: branched-chain amino acid ABC transporter permease [Stellaceae bacterium]|nr:branched-chain amino acid ABC transporter permease [Stellaceae bacterium]